MPALSQEVQIPMPRLRAFPDLEWRLPPKYATRDGDRLVIDIPAEDGPADACATADVPASLLEGAGGFAMAVEASGRGIAKPTKSYLGFKFQLHWRESATGREGYPDSAKEIGDFGPKTILLEAVFADVRPDSATVMLGLQGTSGHVEFDLSTFRAAPTQGLFRRVNEDWVVRYPPHHPAAQRQKPLRGCMLPVRATTEDDIATLASWGATMARFQIARRSDNADLADYSAWVDSRLDNLEDVLRWAGAHGMKICVDLHVTPGGSGAISRGQNMFYDERYATAFVETWRRIATRFRGHPAVYGYDLVNEPLQTCRAQIDYWTIQRRAAEAIREIDPVTPIIVEANHWATPDAFAYLSPLAMDNVIYQIHVYDPHKFTHQGVGDNPIGPKWPDPDKKWTREHLRDVLRPVREFEARHHARIYVGEFSAAAGAKGAENYLRDCIALFNEYGWDWTYHAFREWDWWSVEHEGPDPKHMVPAADTPRKRILLEGFSR